MLFGVLEKSSLMPMHKQFVKFQYVEQLDKLEFSKYITTLRGVETAKIHHILRSVGVKTKWKSIQ